jgi:hypothetical protein
VVYFSFKKASHELTKSHDNSLSLSLSIPLCPPHFTLYPTLGQDLRLEGTRGEGRVFSTLKDGVLRSYPKKKTGKRAFSGPQSGGQRECEKSPVRACILFLSAHALCSPALRERERERERDRHRHRHRHTDIHISA